jgi:predicted RNase H-like nuclease
MTDEIVRGVDGCPAGWIAVTISASGAIDPLIKVFTEFGDLVEAHRVAVDMPIGLPARVEGGGRGPEQAVRPLLGERQSSVFSIPSRSAVYAQDYAEACALAFATSNPPRKISKQAFFLFHKIREIDELLRMRPELRHTVYEVHPEVAFWHLNGRHPVPLPKKVKSRPSQPGLAYRTDLLVAAGFPKAALERAPRGAGLDDLLDAAASALVARRIAAGLAEPYPNPPGHDDEGNVMAIWV